jgi:hypothetical protein
MSATTLSATNGAITTLGATNFSTGNAVISGGYISALTNATITTGAVTTLQATNFSSGNVAITGGYINNLANVTAASGTIATVNASAANVSGALFATSLNTANAVISGGYISALTNATITTATITTLNTVTETAGTLNATAGNVTTLSATNFSSGNIRVSGGYISALTNATITTATVTTQNTGTETAAVLNATAGNVTTLYAGSINTANAVITGGYVNSLANLTATTAQATNFSSGNIYFSGTTAGTVSTANVSLFDSVTALTTNQTFYPQFSNLSTSGNSITGVSSNLSFNPSTGVLTATSFSGAMSGGTASFTTLQATNFSSGNAVISGGYIQNLANITAASSTIGTMNASAANISGALFASSINTANAVITGGYINGLSNLTATTAQVTNFSTGNAVISGGYISALTNATITTASITNGAVTTLQATNFSTGNAVISGGYISALTNATITTATVTTLNAGTTTSATLNATAGNITTLQTTNFSTGNAVISGGYISALTNATITTATITNFASGNLNATGTTSGTWSTANVALSNQVATSSVNATFYPSFYNILSGNAVPFVNSALNYNPSTGVLSATSFSGVGAFSTLSTSGVTTHNANVVIANGSATNNNTTGALVITGTGGIAIAGNINSAGQLFVGASAQATVLTNALAVKRGTSTTGAGVQFTQDALINATNNGSSDFVAYGNNYPGPSNDHGWADVGFTGDAFNDPVYSITKSNDAYMFASAANATVGGNLVLATDYTGSYNDIVIGSGSFYANAEVARFHGNVSNSGTFVLKLPTATTTANTGAFQVWGGASFGSNTYHGGATIFNGGQTAGYDFIVKGKSDGTLIWARPGASYDQVVIGNSATTSTLVTGAKLIINTTDSMMVPVGTTSQRPSSAGGTDTAGMLRYNSTSNALEYYNGTQWQSASSAFTTVTDTQFNGDGSTVTFTSSNFTNATTNGLIVSINGVVQIPSLAYSLTGTTITFTEAPASGDVIDVRVLLTTSSITSIASINGYMGVSADNNGVYVSTGTGSATVYNWFNTGGAFVSNVANVSVASANTVTTIDTLDNSIYRSAKYVIQATNGGSYQVSEALVISDGTTATIVVYGTIQTAGNLGVIAATQSGGSTLVQFIAANATNNVRVRKEYMVI